MPSPLCRSRRGLTALAFDRSFPTAARSKLTNLFAKVGSTLESREDQLDLFTVSYSPSLGYHALAPLVRAAEKLGLGRKTALSAAAHALADAIVTWHEGDLSLTGHVARSGHAGGDCGGRDGSHGPSGLSVGCHSRIGCGIEAGSEERRSSLRPKSSGVFVPCGRLSETFPQFVTARPPSGAVRTIVSIIDACL
jgi:hypothetical protein